MKRALSREDFQTLANLKLEDAPELKFACDLYLFSFYAQGMVFVDIFFLGFPLLNIFGKRARNMIVFCFPLELNYLSLILMFPFNSTELPLSPISRILRSHLSFIAGKPT